MCIAQGRTWNILFNRWTKWAGNLFLRMYGVPYFSIGKTDAFDLEHLGIVGSFSIPLR